MLPWLDHARPVACRGRSGALIEGVQYRKKPSVLRASMRNVPSRAQMAGLGFAEAFAKYGAKLRNVQWSVCAEAPDGSLVVSLWEHHFSPASKGTVQCRDSFARWSGPGNAEFRVCVQRAHATGQRVKVVIAHASDPDAVQSGADASKIAKEFSVRPDWIGRVAEIRGDDYVIEFRRA